jgi:hypothetical protein
MGMSKASLDRLSELSAEVEELHRRGAYDRAAFERYRALAEEAAGEFGDATEFVYRWGKPEWWEPPVSFPGRTSPAGSRSPGA